MKKQPQPEIIYVENADTFMKAVEITEQKTYISNKSIFKKSNREIEIHETRADFLINVAINYAWLINKNKSE